MVSADWNDLKPMQNVTAKGPSGVDDYSNWTYAYNETYHNITVGINELTSKITCYDATMSKTLDPTLSDIIKPYIHAPHECGQIKTRGHSTQYIGSNKIKHLL